MHFAKTLAESNLIMKEANRLGIADVTTINVDVDKAYKSIFGYNREDTLACLPPTSILNKTIIDIADGYKYSNVKNSSSLNDKKATIIINCIKSLPPEHRKFCTRYGIPYIRTLMQKTHNPSLTLHVPPEIAPISREIKTALMIALL